MALPDSDTQQTSPDRAALRASLNTNPWAVARNAASGYVTLLLGGALGLVITPVLLHHLGAPAFGAWSLVLGTAGYLGLLELGLGTATITRVAATEPLGEASLSTVLSSSLALFSGLSLVGIGVSLGLAAAFPVIFHVPVALRANARLAMLLVGTWQSLYLIVAVFAGCLLGTGRMYLVNFYGFAVSTAVSVVQLGALLLGGRLVALAVIQLLGAFAAIVVYQRRVRRAFPTLKIALGKASAATVRLLLHLGSRNAVASLASTLAFGSDVVLVGVLLNPTAAAAYAIGLKGYALLERLTTGVLGAIGPSQAHAAKHASSERRFDLFALSIGTSLPLALCGACCVGLFASPLLHLWLGRVPPHAATVLIVLCAVLVIRTPGFAAYSLLLNSELAREIVTPTLVASATNVAASIVLTILLGTPGPALGSLVAVLVFDAFYFPIRVSQLLGHPYRVLVKRAMLPFALPTVSMVGLLVVSRAWVSRGPVILAVLAAGAVLFVITASRTSIGRQILRLARTSDAVRS